MKKRIWMRILSWILVIAMLAGDAMPVFATEGGSSASNVVSEQRKTVDDTLADETSTSTLSGNSASDSESIPEDETTTEEDSTDDITSGDNQGDSMSTDTIIDTDTSDDTIIDDTQNDTASTNTTTDDEVMLMSNDGIATVAYADGGGSGTEADPYVFLVKDGTCNSSELLSYLTSKGLRNGMVSYRQYRIMFAGETLTSSGTKQFKNGDIYDVKEQYNRIIDWKDSKTCYLQSKTYYDIAINLTSSDGTLSNLEGYTIEYNGTNLTSGDMIEKFLEDENTFTIVVPEITGSAVKVKLDGAEISAGEASGTYIINPSKSATLTVDYGALEPAEINVKGNQYGKVSLAGKRGEDAITVTADEQLSTAIVDVGSRITFTAEPATNCAFFKWIKTDENNQKTELSVTDTTITVAAEDGVTYEAKFYHKTDDKYVAYKYKTVDYYLNSELPDAINDAKSGEMIVLIDDAVVSSAQLVLKDGVTLLLPYQAGSVLIEDANHDAAYSNSYTIESKTLISASDEKYEYVEMSLINSQIVVQSGAKLVTGGGVGSGAGAFSGQTAGKHSDIELDSSSSIEVSGILSSCGYITGGEVNVKNTGIVYEPFIMCDYLGGSYTSVAFKGSGISPFNQYSMINIQSDMCIEPGGRLIGYADLFTGAHSTLGTAATHNRTLVSLIGPENSLIKTGSETEINIEYNPNRYASNYKEIGHTTVTINGGAKFISMSLSVYVPILNNVTVHTSEIVFGLPYNYKFIFENGDYNLDSGFKLLPGTEVYVANNATVIVDDKNSLYVYDGKKFQQYSTYVIYPNGANLTHDGHFEEIANFILDGTLVLSGNATFAGIVQTTGKTGKIIVGDSVNLSAELVDGVKADDRYLVADVPDGNRSTKKIAAQIWDLTTNQLIDIEKGKTYYAYDGDDAYTDKSGNQIKKKLSDYTYTYYADSDGKAYTETLSYQAGYEPILQGSWVDPQITFECGSHCENPDHKAENYVSTCTVDVGEDITFPECQRAGYELSYWKDSNGNEFTATKMQREVITLYPLWEPVTYTITLKTETNGPAFSLLSPWKKTADGYKLNYTVEDEETTVTLPKPEAEGYSFDGWVVNENDTDYVTTVDKSETSDFTYIAKWTIKTHNITLHLEDEVDVETSLEFVDGKHTLMEIEYNRPIADLGITGVSRTGYTLEWKAKDADGKYETVDTMPDHDLDLYAVWTPISYTVTLDPNGGSFNADINNTVSVDFDSKFLSKLPKEADLTAPTGYKFIGWFDDETDGNQVTSTTTYAATGDKTYYAYWTPIEYSISLDAAGGKINASGWTGANGIYTGGTFTVEAASASLPTPIRDGYTFGGWTGENLTEKNEVPKGTVGNQTYIAIWNGVTVKVTLDAMGGDSQKSLSLTYGGKYKGLPEPTRTGYAFKGWYTSKQGEDGTSVENDKVTADSTLISYEAHTLYAHWTANNYTVEYEGNGATSGATAVSNHVYDTASYLTTNGFKRTGYTFVGWNTKADGSGDSYADGASVTTLAAEGKVTLYAQWKINQYTITFDTQGGSAIAPITQNYGTAVTAPPAPTREGYTFAGWDKEIPPTIPAENVTVKAKWTINQYDIHFIADGTTISIEKVYYATPLNDTFALSLDNPTKEGYTFNGWFTNENGHGEQCFTENSTVTLPADNLNLYAHFTPNTYTITFAGNAHDGGTAPESIKAVYDQNVEFPECTFTRTGHSFTGWKVMDGDTFEAGMTATPPNLATGEGTNMTVAVYAQWEPNTYTITFDSDGGSAVEPITQKYGTSVTTPENPTREGYTFKGWNPTLPEIMPAGGLTLKAQWEANEYTITFNSEGGTDVALIKQAYLSEVKAPTAPTKEGYTFVGWFTEKEGKGTQYFADTVKMPLNGLTLYAHWTINSYTITFDSDGGSEVDPITQDYGTSVTAPKNPTRTGYTFTGWSSKVPDTMPAKNLTLKAQWKANEYTITFDSAGGSSVEAITQDYGMSVTAPKNPTKTGYNFKGWNPKIPTTMPAKDQTLTAQWEADTYQITLHYGYPAVEDDSKDKTEQVTVTYDQFYAYGTNGENGLKNAERAGYAFDGWFTEENGQGHQIQPTDKVETTTPPTDLYAKWSATAYSIRYDSVEGITGLKQGYDADNLPLEISAISKNGYIFKGWTIGEDTTLHQSYTIPTGTTGDLFFKANWEKITYTITYNSDGGVMPESPVTTYEILEESALPLPVPMKTGHTFNGWRSSENQNPVTELSVGSYGDKDFTAVWTANTYNVTLNYGYEDKSDETIKVVYGENYGAGTSENAGLKDASRTGYSFDGWFTSQTGGNKVSPSDTVTITEGQTLYAHWTANKYQVTLNTGGGSLVGGQDVIITVTYDAKYGSLATPVKTGYKFTGWYYEAQEASIARTTPVQVTEDTIVKVAEDDILYAHWEEIVYTVKLSENGGSFTAINWDKDAQDTYYKTFVITDEAFAIPAISRVGYTFKGWNPDVSMDKIDPAVLAADLYAADKTEIVYTAAWVINQYTITFDTDGGSEVAAITQDYGTGITKPSDPTKEGYTFEGWTPQVPDTMPAENLTVKAGWTINKYQIIFEADGTDVGTVSDIDYATKLNETFSVNIVDPVKVGYTFKGWYTQRDGEGEQCFVNGSQITLPANDLSVYAYFTPNSYTISFDGNASDGGIAPNTVTAIYDADVELPKCGFTKTGHHFTGWNTSADGTGTGYSVGTAEKPNLADGTTTKNVTLYAQWEANEYTITFDSDGGSPVAQIKQDYGTGVTKPTAPTKEGYTFAGWNPALPETMPAGDLTLKAQWEANKYTITFDCAGGTAVAPIEQAYLSEVQAPTEPTRTGYTFAGWFDAEGNEYFKKTEGAVAKEIMPLDGLFLTAKWNINTYTVAFRSQNAEYASEQVVYGERISQPEVPDNKIGYTFAYWYAMNEQAQEVPYFGENQPYTMPAENLTLYAAWIPNTYTVRYDANGGTGTVSEQSFTYDVNHKLAQNGFEKEGHRFVGWKKNINDTQSAYEAGKSVKNLTSDKNGVVTLYAHWEVNSYTITLKLNDTLTGTKVEYIFPEDEKWVTKTVNASYQAQYSADYNTKLPVPSIPTRTGYNFTAWHMSSDLNEESVFVFDENAVMPSKNQILYASWELKDCEITYGNVENCTFVPETIKAKYSEKISAPQDPQKEGYSFKGWYTDAACSNGKQFVFTENTVMPENMVLYAKWQINSYKVSYINTGEITIPYDNVEYQDTVEEPTVIPTWKGYIFKHWSLTQDGEMAEFPITMPANDLNIYAVYESYLDMLLAVDAADGSVDFAGEGELAQARSYFMLLNDSQKAEYQETAHWTALSAKIKEVSTVALRQSVIDAEETTNEILSKVDSTEEIDGEKVTITIDLAEMKVFDENLQADPPRIEGMIKEDQYAAINMLTVEFMTALFEHDEIVSIVADNDREPDVVLKEHELTGETIESAGTLASDQFNIMLMIAWAAMDPNASQEDFMNYLQSQMTTLKLDALDGKSVYLTAKAESPEGVPYEVTYILEFYSETHDLIYNFAGGTTENYLQAAKYEQTVTLPTPEKRGYTFDGWNSDTVEINDQAFVMGKTDVNLTAQWTLNQYEIGLDLGQGSLIDAVSVSWQDNKQSYDATTASIVLPTENQIIAPTGYKFGGWYMTDEADAKMSVTLNPADEAFVLENLTFVAKWIPIEYELTLDFANGTDSETILFTVETTEINLPTPTRYGYSFTGWDKTLSFPMQAADVTLTAQWEAKKVNVILNHQDDENKVINTTVIFGENFGSLPTPTREGYGFDGWFDAKTGGQRYDGTITVTSENPMTLYAHWTAGSYTIAYAGMEGAINHGDNPSSYVVDTEVELKEPTKTGYTFTGWTGECVEERNGNYFIKAGTIGTQTITANWQINQYTISFDSKGGNTVADITADYLESVPAPVEPTRTGYTFKGWYAGTTQYFADGTSAVMPLDGLKLTAKWEINSHSITFVKFDGSNQAVKTYNYNQTIEPETAAEVEGYTFLGWKDADGNLYFTVEDGSAKTEVMPDQEVKVYATYHINQYTFSFDTGCDMKLDNITADYGSEVTAPTEPEKEGHTFTGWFDEDGKEYFVKDTLGIVQNETMPSKDTLLIASWSVNRYTFSFDVDGDTEVEIRIEEDYGTSVDAPEEPVKKGYLFTGWVDEAGISYFVKNEDGTVKAEMMPAENVALTAGWQAIRYTVTFDDNGAEAETIPADMTELHYDQTYNLPTENLPEKVGYDFAGWSAEKDGKEPLSNIKNLTDTENDIVALYAIWTAKSYTVTFDANGGVVEPESMTVTYDKTYEGLPTPEREGYTFSGWSDGVTIYTENSIVQITEDKTLTAQWTEKGDTPYTVIHYLQNVNNDEYTEDKYVKYTGKTNGTANAQAEAYTGFNLNVETSTMSGTITGDGKLVLKLYYDRIEYKITWNAGGKVTQENYRYEAVPVYKGEKDYQNDHGIYTFTGWDQEIIPVTKEAVYTAAYEADYEASIGDVTYATLQKALQVAKSGETVRLDKDISLEEDLVIPAGVNLLLPCIDDDYGYNLVDKGKLKFNHDGTSTAGGTGVGPYAKLYRTMNIPVDVTVTVQGNMMINSVSGRPVGGTADMDITGGYAVVNLDGNIIVEKGGNLDCFGYVKGEGTITAENGGSIGDLYIVRHWRGGTQAFEMYQSIYEYGNPERPDRRQVYPMNEYDCHNIETTVIVKYGASYDGLVKMCANAGDGNAYYYTRFPQVNNTNGMIRLINNDGYVVREYDVTADRDTYNIYGGAKFAESSLNIAGVSLSTEDFIYPIDGDICFELYDGNYHFINDYKFLTGGGMTVHSGAALTVDDGVYVAFYDEFHDKPNTGDTQYPKRDKTILYIEEDAKFTNAGTFGGSIVTESPDILIGDYPTWTITTLEANGYCNDTVSIFHDLFITREGYSWRYGDPTLGEEKDSIIWIGADYTALNEALKTVPEDLRIYSEETVKPLQDVISQIVYGLGQDKQDQVDDWTKAIISGVENLKLRVVKVTFNPNGGNCKTDSMNITYGETYGELPAVEYYGYKFLGWFDSDNMQITPEMVMKKFTDEIVLTARWETIPADYTEVNEAIAAIPADMTGYTAASVQSVYDARDAVDMTLGLAQQSKVDAMADAILEAIAKLERVQIQISFDANGGNTITETFTVKYGDTYPYAEFPVPQRDGFEFIAWYTAKEGGTEVKADTKVAATEDIILYAKWSDSSATEPADYTAVEAALEKIPKDLTPYNASSVNKLNEAVDAVVYGLMEDRQEDIDAWAAAIEQAVKELTYKTITVYFDPAGGNCEMKSLAVTYGTEVKTLPEASKEYSTFLGWFTAKEGGRKVEASELSSKTENLTLYAQYELLPADYSKIEEVSALIPADLRCYSDASVKKLNAALTQIERGYTADQQFVVDRWAEELQAAYEGLTYRIMTMTYDAQGGKVSPKSAQVQYNSIISWLPTPELAYNVFDGWFTEAEGGEKVTLGMVVKNVEDFSIYAHWIQTDADYTRVYEALAKVPSDEELVNYTEDTVAALKAAINAVEYGLNAGHQSQVNNWASAIDIARQKLKGKSVTITFEYNGGTGKPPRRTVSYGRTYGTLPEPTKEGCTFIGWFTENVGGEQIFGTTKIPTAKNHTIYARWDDGKADYTAVKAAIAKIPADLSVYTEESAAKVHEAVGAVVYDLPNTEQDQVDAYAKAIELAIKGLKEKEEVTPPECSEDVVGEDCPQHPYKDLNPLEWYHLNVDYVIENGLMVGISETYFGPENVTSRGMVATILYRMSGEKVSAEQKEAVTFTDVSDQAYYADAVAWAAANGVVKGYSVEKFGPEDPITREQMLVMLHRYGEYMGYDVSSRVDLSYFADDNDVSSWAVEAVQWGYAGSVMRGMMSRTGEPTINPQGELIRVQMAAFVHRFCEAYQP